METNDRILTDLEAELKTYPTSEREKISVYIQRILKGELSELVSEKAFPKGALQKIKESLSATFKKMAKSVLETSKAADSLAEAISKKTVSFSFKISESEKSFILATASSTIQRIYTVRELVLSDLTLLYLQSEKLLMLQGSLLAYTSELEIIKAAADISAKLYGTKYTEATVSEPLSIAHSEMQSASELEKNVLHLASIYEDTFENKIYRILDDIAEAADLSGDGKCLSKSKITDAAINIKNATNNITRTQRELL
jgi:hypothetical protein